MPKVAILSDVHANLPALKAVLEEADASDAEEIVFGGDVIGYGAWPEECVEMAMNHGGRSVLGNHDVFTKRVHEIGEKGMPVDWRGNPVWAGIHHAVENLDLDQLEWIWSQPLALSLDGAILAHASLHKPYEWLYLDSAGKAQPTLDILREKGIAVGFFGHTHRQDFFTDPRDNPPVELLSHDRFFVPEGAVCAVTVGSVGQPRVVGDARATWTIWDPEARIFTFRQTAYSTEEAARGIVEAGLPVHSALRLLPENKRAAFAGLSLEEIDVGRFLDLLEKD